MVGSCPQAVREEAAAVSRRLTAALPDAIVAVLDPELRVVLLDGDVLVRRGNLPPSVIGRRLAELALGPIPSVLEGCWLVLEGGTWQGEYIARRDGTRFWVQATPLHVDGRVAGVVLVAQDTTPREAQSVELDRSVTQQTAVAELGRRIAAGLSGAELDAFACELVAAAMDADVVSLLDIDDAVAARDVAGGVEAPVGNPVCPSGILRAHSRTPRRFGPHDVAFMQAVAGLLAGAAERDRSALLMADAQARFRSAFQQAPIGMALFATHPAPGEPVVLQVNDALCALLGRPADELLAIDPVELGHPDDAYVGVAEAMALASGRAQTYSVEKRLLRGDGEIVHARIHGSIVEGTEAASGYAICQVEDLTETKRLREEEDRIWDLSADLLAIIGPSGFVKTSPSWERCLGYPAEELAALPFEELIHPDDQDASTGAFARAVYAPEVEVTFESRVRTRRGDWRWLAWSARSGEPGPGDPVRVYCTARDITQRRETQRALVESLSLFDQSFENAPIGMAITEPGTGRHLRVNDALCRLLGRTEDELLALESAEDIVAPDVGAEAERRLVRGDGSLLWVAQHATPIRDADGAVTAYFSQIVDIDAQKARQAELQRQLDEIGWVAKIRDALDHDRFELHSQPIVDLATGAVVQRELLIRMRDEEGELVPPGDFLPAAEEHGLIEEIDRWVLSQAVLIAAGGQAVEVNVSAASMSCPEFLVAVERELASSGADPADLVFEITETALMRQMDLGVAFAERLAGLGCRFALDDFGTGYGSFTYLKRLPVHYLKIDRDFVRDLAGSPRDRHVVQAIVNLAGGFEAQTIAEGVEDAETLELLREYGVDSAQGFHLGRPAPFDY